MKAVATDGRSGLEVVDIPRPTMPPDGGIVRVVACGLCGSDLEKLSGAGSRPGRVLGHEVVGILERPGRPDTRVALAHHVPCGHCLRCRSGHSSLCEQFVQSDLVPGGFAETLAVSSLHLTNAVFPLPAEVDDLAGTLLEPLSCVLRSLDTAGSLLSAYPPPGVKGPEGKEPRTASGFSETPGESNGPALPAPVLVAGCGAVGLLFLAVLAAQLGALQGHLFLEPRDDRAILATGLGASALSPETRPEEGVQLALLTAPAALSQVVEAMAPGGVIIVFAAGPRVPPLDLELVYRRELTLAGVRSGSPAHLRAALDLLTSGRLDLRWLQPLVVGLDGLPSAVERYARGEVLKVVVRP